jgi:hypothetical protein
MEDIGTFFFSVCVGASDDSRKLEPGDRAGRAGARRPEHMREFSTKSLASDGQKKAVRRCSPHPADAESAGTPAPDGFDQTFHRLHGSGQAPHLCASSPSHWGAAQAGECQGPGQSVMRPAPARTWAENEERKRALVSKHGGAGRAQENVKVLWGKKSTGEESEG